MENINIIIYTNIIQLIIITVQVYDFFSIKYSIVSNSVSISLVSRRAQEHKNGERIARS